MKRLKGGRQLKSVRVRVEKLQGKKQVKTMMMMITIDYNDEDNDDYDDDDDDDDDDERVAKPIWQD